MIRVNCEYEPTKWRLVVFYTLNMKSKFRLSNKTCGLSLTLFNSVSTVIDTVKNVMLYTLGCIYISTITVEETHRDVKDMIFGPFSKLLLSDVYISIEHIIRNMKGITSIPTCINYVESLLNNITDDTDNSNASIVGLLLLITKRYFNRDPVALARLCISIGDDLNNITRNTTNISIIDNNNSIIAYNDLNYAITLLTPSSSNMFRNVIDEITIINTHSTHNLNNTNNSNTSDVFEVTCPNKIDEPKDYLTRYKMVRKIGEGIVSEVYLVESKHDGMMYARKTQKLYQSAIVELNILSSFKNDNMINLNSFILMKDTLHLILDYADTSLRDLIGFHNDKWYDIYINENASPNLDEKYRYSIHKGLCVGLRYLHDNGIIHRDLKPENILMLNNVPKIADFGLSLELVVYESDNSLKDIVGTPLYMAPELLLTEYVSSEHINKISRYSFEIDIWSLGVIMTEIECGTTPFTDLTLEERRGEGPKDIDTKLVLWCMFRILGSPWIDSLPMYKYVEELGFYSTDSLSQIHNSGLRILILNMLSYYPKDERPNIDTVCTSLNL